MTRHRLALVCLLAGVLALAGCGSTKVVTKTVRAKPCASAAKMAACVVDNATSFSARHGQQTSGIDAKCRKHGTVWTCLMILPTPPFCVDVRLYTTPRLGLLDIDVLYVAPRSRCKTTFPGS